MKYTAQQIKGKIKNLGLKTGCDPRLLIRIYMMERILERLAASKYKEHFIIKGGILVTSLIGISQRTTMDIDTTITGFNLEEEEIKIIMDEIINTKIDDGISFKIVNIEQIMSDMDYPGLRIRIDAFIDKIIVPIIIDISTGDIITPKEINYKYKLLLEDKEINISTYNLETILSEKLQSILSRGIANTRMRDFYDIYVLSSIYEKAINYNVLAKAFAATCKHRKTESLLNNYIEIIDTIKNDIGLKSLWNQYINKYAYAANISFDNTITSIEKLIKSIKEQ